MSRIDLTVPARPEFVQVLRTVVAAAAARVAFSIEAIEDLRIAVDEACAFLLGSRGDPSEMRIKITDGDGRFEIRASTNGSPEPWPPSRPEENLTWQVLSALADEASFGREGAGPAVQFAKALPALYEAI